MHEERRSPVAHLRPGECLDRLESAGKERFLAAYQRGTLAVELYAPRGHDPQAPHGRDEVYVVVTGSGDFIAGEERFAVHAGDLLFVAAGARHRFERFSDDLVVWVLFFGTP